MEVVHNLLNYSNLKIVQNTEWFNFSLDSVLLAHFVDLSNTESFIDFCCGNAPVPLMIAAKNDNINILGVEIQKEVFDLAIKSVELNNLNNKINIVNEDIRNLDKIIANESIDTITCNPPFFKVSNSSKINENKIKSIARHEIMMELDDIFRISKRILKNGGNIAIVHRSERLCDIINCMRNNLIEPKRIQFIYPKIGTTSNIVLVEGVKNGRSGLKIMEPIIAHNEDGEYTDIIKKMFE